MNVTRGLTGTAATEPLYWPPQNNTAPFRQYNGGELPDPIAMCGYTGPANPCMMLRLPTAVTGTSTGTFRNAANQTLDSCVYNQNTFTDPINPTWQALGRQEFLGGYNAVILVPKNPLVPGTSYSVTLNVGGQDYAWSFDTGKPLPVTIKPDAKSRSTLQPDPAFTFSLTGLQGNDTAQTVFTSPANLHLHRRVE